MNGPLPRVELAAGEVVEAPLLRGLQPGRQMNHRRSQRRRAGTRPRRPFMGFFVSPDAPSLRAPGPPSHPSLVWMERRVQHRGPSAEGKG